MPKLPTANDVDVIGPRAARSFTNIPVADYQGAFGAVGRGLAAVGEGARVYADAVDKRAKDEEAFGANLRLADAQVAFSSKVAGLDPSDPEFSAKRMKVWSETFKPIIGSLQHPENQQRFGEWAYENGAKAQIEGETLARTASVEKTKLQLGKYMELQQKLVAQGTISPEQASANVKAQIAQAPYLFDNDKMSILQSDGAKFNAAVVEMTAINSLGKVNGANVMQALVSAESSNDPNAVSGKGALGLAQVMPTTAPEIAKELGDEAFFKMSDAQRKAYLLQPEVSLRYGAYYLDKMLRRYNGDLEAALVAYNAGPGNADKWVKSGRDYKALPKPEETGPYVQKILTALGGPSAPAVVQRRGQSETTMLASLEADPLFRELPVSLQTTVRDSVRTKYKEQFKEQERLALIAGTRSVVDELVMKYPKPEDRDEAFAELPKRIKDPEYLEDARTMLRTTYATADENTKANNDAILKDVSKTVTTLVSQRDPKGALDAIETSKATDADKAALREFVRSGGALKDNQWVVDDLTAKSISKDPAQRQAFLDANLDKLLLDRQITVETANKLRKAQTDLVDGKSVSEAFDAARPIVDARLGEIGLRITAQSKPADIAIKNRVESLIKRNLEAAANGGPLAPKQVEEVVDSTLRQWVTEKPRSSLNPVAYVGDGTYSASTNLNEVMQTFQKKEDELIANPDATTPDKRVQYPGQLLERAYTEIEQGAEKKRREIQSQIGMARDDFEVNRLRARLKALDSLTIDGSLLDNWFRNEFPE